MNFLNASVFNRSIAVKFHTWVKMIKLLHFHCTSSKEPDSWNNFSSFNLLPRGRQKK